MKQFLRYTLTLVVILLTTTPAWAATATLGAKKQNVTADGITFSLGGSYTINNILVDYSYTGSDKEASLSWTVPTGYTISVSQITINAKNAKSWGTTGKGQYKTSKNGSYSQFCNSNSFVTYTLNSSSYFPLGNDGSITIKAIDKELQWKDIVFTYTKTAHKYNIAFNANGGTGTTQGISNVSYDTNVNLTPNGFTRNKFIVTYDANGGSCSPTEEIRNYTFAGWAETSNGAVKYADKQSVKNLTSTNGATVTLYAKWNEPDNATLILPTATKTGAVLEGWYLDDTKIGEAGDTYTPTSSVTLTAKWIEKYTPEIKGSDATILVGEEIPNAFTFKNTSNPTAIITKKSISDIRNGEDVITYDATENKIIAHNAGVAEIYFVQDPTSTIEGGTSATYTITVNKNLSSFTLNFADEYFVDDQIAQSTFLVSPTNTEVPISVTDNKGYFSYTNDNLIANCPTPLPADNDQTTITVTQPENYKWTSYSLNKTVTVKKYPTDFSWLLQDTYFVGETITSIFNKSANNLPSTITSSDPTIVKVENNQLIALRAGKVKITISQAVDRKWIAFTHEKEITIVKRSTNFQLLLGNTYYVDDQIADAQIYSKVSENTLPVSIVSSNNDILIYDADNHKLIARNAGKATIRVSQDKDTTWTHFDQSIEVTVLKHNIVATITPNNAYWNELIPNPFAATSTHPVTKQVTKIDNFNVAQQGNEHIALMDANTRNIQTYYTNGTVNFLITRDADRKYNALSQTLTLTVNANTSGCNPTPSHTTASVANSVLSSTTYSEIITYQGVGDTLVCQIRVEGIGNASNNHYLTPQYSTTDNGDFTDFPNSQKTVTSNSWSNDIKFAIPDGTKRIRFKRTAASGGTRTIAIRNIAIIRAPSLKATPNPLSLPKTAVGTPDEAEFILEWNTCADIILLTHKNPHFTLNHYSIASNAGKGSTKIIVSCDAQEVTTYRDTIIIYDQTQMIPVPVECVVRHKIQPAITVPSTYNMLVDSDWENVFTYDLDSIETSLPTENESDPFYYTIEHNFDGNDIKKPGFEDKVITYDAQNNKIFAHNEGTAIIKLIHNETDGYYGKTATCTLTVSKHDAELNWKDPVYYNDTISNYFTTTDTISPIVIVSQTDTDVAKLTNEFNPTSNNSLDLITFNKEASTTVTVSQKENYKWNGYSIDHIITPIDPSNHVTFTIDSEARMWVFQPTSNEQLSWSNGIKVTKGDLIDANWDDRYVIINFTGIPKDMSFSFEPSVDGTTYEYWYVDESPNGQDGTWTRAWNTEGEGDNYERGTVTEHPLLPTTRYLKLCYSGNYGGIFKNLHVTELNQFEAVPNVLDFGLQYVDNPKTTKSFDFKYANAGYKVHLQSTDTMFTVATTYIDTIGGEKYGTVHDIQVTYNPLHVHKTTGEDAMILIWDEAGHRDTVFLHVNTVKSKPSLYWTEDWSATEPIVLLDQHMPDTVAKATNGYPVKYRSYDESILKIADDSLSFIAVGIGETYITAHADSDRVYLQPDTIRKLFRVTDKLVQRIVWEDNLTDFCINDGPDTLRAQVWVLIDAANGTWEYSPEQTAKLQYSSPNSNIATVSDSILTIHGVGEMFLNATVPADEDDSYERASAQIPVRVRDCSVQCTDADLIIPILKADGARINPEDLTTFNPYLRESEKIVAIDTTAGIPGHLIFAYAGRREWGTLAGKIRVFESTDGGYNWQQVLSDADAVTPLDQQAQYSPYIPLSRNATHIKFERFEQVMFGYHYLQYITITPAQYIESIPDDIDFGNVYLGNTVDSTIAITYSSLRSNLQITSSHPTHLTTDKTTIEDECGAWDTIPLTISLKADISIMGNYHQYITVTDPIGGMTDTIHVYANIVKNSPTITWNPTDTIRSSAEWETQKTAISSSGDPVLYELTAGDLYAYLNDTGKMILLRGGRITARAYTAETTTSNEVSAYHDFIIVVDPLFEDFSNDGNWLNDNNWNIGRIPWTTDSATIAANKHVSLDTEIITEGLSFESGSSIHITSTGGLTVGAQGIQGAADGSSIIIDNNPQGAGFLLISPSALEAYKHPYFTMYFTTRAFNEGVPRDETWQYMGAPGNNATIKDLDSQTLIYHWDETKGWTPYTITDTIPTWQGYALTQSIETNHTYHITAQAMQETKTINLTYTASGMKGDNLFVNSFTAPIDITTFTKEDITGNWSHQTFYFFNTGSWNDWQGTNPDHSHDDASSAGHYYTVPLFSAPYLEGSQTIVPPMQGVYVHTDEVPVSITLDYEKHVWNGAAGNLPMRAPQKQSPDFQRVRIQVSSENSGADRMYIIQEPSTTRNYDNGYDGKNINAKGQVNIYTNEPFGKMEVSCANNIDSMYIGLRTGNDSLYTLTFGAIAGDSLYLQDLENDSIIPLFDDEQYHFTAEPNTINNNRFLLLSHPRLAPNGDTSTPDVNGDEITKIWSIGKVIYIANAPANSVASLYTVGGHLVLSTPIANTQSPAILDVSYLPEGVYILRLNNQVYKFVCK